MDPLAPLIDALHGQGRLRAWSLVITVFGDLVQHRGGEVSTARLGALLGRVGVEPGTLRTALSRLTRDGWVKRERTGRSSRYRLSAQGVARFAPATSHIYAPPRVDPVERWRLSVSLGTGGEPLVRLDPAEAPGGQGADCAVSGRLEALSPAYRAAGFSPSHRAALEALATDLHVLKTEAFDGLDAAAARMLLIHRWRRVVLRFPERAPGLLPDDAALADPRAAVAGVYTRLLAPAEAWLDAPCNGDPAMPRADATLARRFAMPLEG